MDEQNKNQNPAPQDEPIVADESKELKEKLELAEKQRDEYLGGWQRAKADFINYKKEEMTRLSEIAKYASEDLVREMIVVLDNFDLGLAALEEKGQVEKGVYMIRAQMEDVLKRRGLVKVDMKAGDAYDPSIAEAIAEVDPPAGGKIESGSIVEIIEPGYKLNDKLIRPARVKVAK